MLLLTAAADNICTACFAADTDTGTGDDSDTEGSTDPDTDRDADPDAETDHVQANVRDGQYDATLLHWAVNEGHTPTVEHLLACGADVRLTDGKQ